ASDRSAGAWARPRRPAARRARRRPGAWRTSSRKAWKQEQRERRRFGFSWGSSWRRRVAQNNEGSRGTLRDHRLSFAASDLDCPAAPSLDAAVLEAGSMSRPTALPPPGAPDVLYLI